MKPTADTNGLIGNKPGGGLTSVSAAPPDYYINSMGVNHDDDSIELTHTAHYNKLGNGWHIQFVNAELNEITSTINSINSPYGDGNQQNPDEPIIALGESWAYYMGHYMADKEYGTNASCPIEQNGSIFYCNGTNTFHPHLDVLEFFNPNLGSDPFRWIPKGLYQDLRDNTTPSESFPVIDLVSGFTNAQLFNVFNNSLLSVTNYKNNLIYQNSGNQTSNIIALFNQYHY